LLSLYRQFETPR